jgi:hypothetical protein
LLVCEIINKKDNLHGLSDCLFTNLELGVSIFDYFL